MKIESIILGRPWLYDHDVQLAGRANTCSFMHSGRRFVWVTYTAQPTARRLPPPHVGLIVVRGPEFQRNIQDELVDTPVCFSLALDVPTGAVITCIFNLNYYLILLIFMLILYDYDACYHSFYKFSPLVCHFTKVHIYTLFRVNYVLYGGLIFFKIK